MKEVNGLKVGKQTFENLPDGHRHSMRSGETGTGIETGLYLELVNCLVEVENSILRLHQTRRGRQQTQRAIITARTPLIWGGPIYRWSGRFHGACVQQRHKETTSCRSEQRGSPQPIK
eukprot:3772406-Pyramimonas_sp.AAC.1